MQHFSSPKIPGPITRLLYALPVLVCVFAGAAGIAAQAASTDPATEAVALFNRAQASHESGDIKAALGMYEQALKILPEFPEAEYQRGHALLSLGKLADAEQAFRRAVDLREDWTLALAALGSVLVSRAEYAEAEPFLIKALELEPLNFPAFVSLVDMKLATGAGTEALNGLLNKAAALTSKANPTATLWSARAALERSTGKLAAARASIAKALEIDPHNLAVVTEAAAIAIEGKDPARAADLVAQLESRAPGRPNTVLLRAKYLLLKGDTQGASAALAAVEEPDALIEALRGRVGIELSADPASLEKQLAAEPANPAILGRLCVVYRRQDPVRSLDFCRRAVEAEPAEINHAIGFGAALVQAKRFDEAVTVLRRLADADPANATIRANLATALFQLKRFAEAKVEYRGLLDGQPNLYTGYYFLAIAHDRLEEYPDAMANYQEFLKRADPARDSEEIERIKLRLPSLRKQLSAQRNKKKD